MLAVIDESGDPGFSIGSSPYFVVVMILFDRFADAQCVAHIIQNTKRQMSVRRELKFNGSSNRVRTQFMDAMRNQPFRFRAVAIHKHAIRDSSLRKYPKQFAFHAFHRLMSEGQSPFNQSAVLKIDRYGDRSVRDTLATYLRQHLPRGTIKSIKFVDTRHDVLIQLADMIAGAVAKSLGDDADDQWINMIAARTEHIAKY